MEFAVSDDGGVAALVECDGLHQGYSGVLHGGIVALLLDGAMTNCLFAAGVTALTAHMSIRYLKSATTDKPVRLEARITHSRPPLYLLESEMRQGEVVVARASGKFMTP
ncbi:MAG: PaaI family thioesterase [Anaerolineales bacterium]